MDKGEESTRATCHTCRKEVKNKDRGVACDGCDKWFHDKCGDIGPELYQILKEFKGDKLGTDLGWFCTSCSGCVKSLRKDVLKLKKDHQDIEKQVVEMRKEIDALKKDKLEKKDGDDVKKAVEGLRAEGEGLKKLYAEADNRIVQEMRKEIEVLKKDKLDKKDGEEVRKVVEGIKVDGEVLKKSFR
jgi:PHD-finger